MKASDDPVIVEQTLEATPETVWRAITEPELMRQWYFENIPSFKAEVGFETQFNIENEGRNFLHIWKVTEVVPLKRLAYGWKYDSYTGDALVLFELFEHGSSTKLKLSFRVRDDFPDNIPEFKRESCIGGWEFFIQQSLKEYLSGANSDSKQTLTKNS